MSQKLKVLVFLIMLGSYVSAQVSQVKGTVTDVTGETLIGVNVIVEGTSSGVITDIDGNYSIQVEPGSRLLFRFIGFKEVIIPFSGQSTINVMLEPDVLSLDEVVVVGYGQQKKPSVVGSIAQASGEDLQKRGNSTNFTDVLSGAMPGIVVQTRTGLPGGGGNFEGDESFKKAEILIRGKSTWNSNAPLILVDGIERNMEDIDVADVENISVLKDASATAVFGVKGANGVILINTKRGKDSKPVLKVEASSTFKRASRMPSVVDSYTGIKARNYAIINELATRPDSWGKYVPGEILEYYRSGEYPYAYPNVDWKDVMLKDWGRSHRINVNVNGGSKNVRYFSSLGYSHEGDILKTEDVGQGYVPAFQFDRYNFRNNVDFKLSSTTDLAVSLSGYIGTQQRPGVGDSDLWQGVYLQPADVLVQYPDGTYNEGVPAYERFGANRYLDLNYSGLKKETRSEVQSNLKLTQDLSVLVKGLKASAVVAFDNFFKTQGQNIAEPGVIRKIVDPAFYTNTDPDKTEADYTTWYYPNEFNTSSHGFDFYRLPNTYSNEEINGNMINATRRKLYYRTDLNYARQFEKHEVSALALFSREEKYSYTGDFSGFPERREDWVARLTYNYDLRYMFEVNGSYSGSEMFGPGNKFDFFPSVALGWNIMNERFFRELAPAVNNLKVRYSAGSVGNMDVWVDGKPLRWGYTTLWNRPTGQNDKAFRFGDPLEYAEQRYTEGTPGNPELRWETAFKQNLGLEFGVLQNMLSFTVDFWDESREDILMAGEDRTVPTLVGKEAPAANLGRTYSQGLEFEARFSRAHGNGLKYWSEFSWTYAKNTILYMEDALLTPDYQKKEGFAIDQNGSQISSGIIGSWDELYLTTLPLSNPDYAPGDYKIIDYNSDGKIDNDDHVPYGYANYPMNTYAFALGGEYKGFSLSLQFYGVYNVTQAFNPQEFFWTSSSIFEDELSNTFTPEYGNSNPSFRSLRYAKSAVNAEYNSRDASYLRLKTAEIGYSLPQKIISPLGVSSLRLYANGNNLFLWTNYPVDVEGDSFNERNYPVTKQVTFGLNVTF